MGKGRVIILGKGESALRCDVDFVNTFDKVVICNYPVLKGYEKNFPYKADIWYRNKSCKNLTKQEFEKLGIKEVVYTGQPNTKLCNDECYDAKVSYPDWWSICKKDYDLDPNTGLQAFLDLVEQKYDSICLVGFDMQSKGTKPYFFDKKEAPENLKYLWNSGHYNNDTINFVSGHNPDKSFDVIKMKIKENTNIDFIIISNYKKFYNLGYSNLKVL